MLRGHYRAVRPLGRGGFGKTYLAVDRDRLDTPCVIKQFSPRVKTRAALKKSIRLFSQEAIRLRDLGEHPQIPSLLAYFEDNGRLYLVQEFIAGPNLLQEFHRNGPFNEQQILRLLKDMLPVLHFIHDKSVIHRDLKPDNIICRKTDDRYVAIDFGIAKQLDPEGGGKPGTKIGTEGYSPIEQLRGGQAYPASDLYSLGVICIFLLTGVPPDELFNPLTGHWPWREQLAQWNDTLSLEELHGGTPPVLIPDASKAAQGVSNKGAKHTFAQMPVTTGIDERVGLLLDKMLEQAVRDRYQSAQEVMADLQTILTVPASS
ncbi:MAG: serine/threonine-protein kinase [Cyanobacteria bacterium P01_D01_bin.73]